MRAKLVECLPNALRLPHSGRLAAAWGPRTTQRVLHPSVGGAPIRLRESAGPRLIGSSAVEASVHAARRTHPRVAAPVLVVLIAVAAALAYLGAGVLAADAAKPPATTNPPLHQDPPITAGEFEHDDDCDVPAGQDLFHFVLPGRDAVFTAFSATFELPNGTTVTYTLGTSPNVTLVQRGKGINVVVPAGSTLLAASATTSAPVPFFNLSHTCVGGGGPSPSPSPSPGYGGGYGD